ncbi:type 1 glutamine amidotransferase domain-containing protein [Vitiosangium sp. GDMCC 1.1324]|uniref:type 1 glutamine amidotransferase domain-containing protein n=1 Tax=Vitiosangium sp. (strain GDMCC 1.1324) TaxID=2138576 RepID=UPI000D3B7071|nr:type 1 glutamine amidotransferase domain-containing protein [Vitiosangium sp. GDMCC 1.1324]PTL77792.1 protease [Vitiosangium sp. GDMCC 1.1324]
MAGKRVACVVGHDFEDSELRIPYDRLRGGGHEVVLIGKKKGEVLEGKRGKEKFQMDLGIDDARVEDFDMLLIPGGYSPDNLRADERFVRFVKEFDDRGKLIAAVCHGPQLLMAARVVEGRTLTAWKTIQADLELAGIRVKDEAVVRDANFITSRQPDDLEDFSRAILEDLRTERAGAREGAGVPVS